MDKYIVTLTHDDVQIKMVHGYEYTALSRCADVMLWAAMTGTEYTLTLTHKEEVILEVGR